MLAKQHDSTAYELASPFELTDMGDVVKMPEHKGHLCTVVQVSRVKLPLHAASYI